MSSGENQQLTIDAKDIRNDKDENKAQLVTKIVICILVLLVVGLTVVVIMMSVRHSKTSSKILHCKESSSVPPKFTKSQDIFRDLTRDELLQVRNYILSVAALNVTPYEKAGVDSNYIFLIELHNPEKDKVIEYLDNNGSKPIRAANVVLFKGAVSPAVIEEILVYFDSPLRHEPNTYLTNHTIPFISRSDSKFESDRVDELIKDFGKQVHEILKESFDGYTLHNCTTRCLTYSSSAPTSIYSSNEHHSWFWVMREEPAVYLQPVGLELLIQRESTNVEQWKIEKVYYSKTIFDSVEEFIQSYKDGKVKKIFLPALTEDERNFSTLKQRGKYPQPSHVLREPQQFEPDGKRYAVQNNHIEYMGWSFDFRVRTTSGPQIFDIRFNGERIVYELSIQEPGSFYSAYSPMQSYSNYLDSTWALGTYFELVKGVDCPNTATFFDVTYFHDSSHPGTRRNAVCVFEHNLAFPLRRHFENDFKGSYYFHGGLTGTALVMRTISTPYNYDYIFDYIFYPNGVIEAKVFTSGYLQTTFWTSEEDNYGNQVHKNVAGTLHDHIFHYKVDLDVGGRKNRFETITAKLQNISSIWFPNKRHVQKVLQRDLKKTEMAAAYKFNFQRPSYLNFYNDAKKNAYGVRRGYRVQLNGILHQLYPEDWQFTSGFSWSFYQLAVTKYKKTEERSSTIYNQNDFYNPVVNFKKFLEDNENIVDEDLVSWITVALMHIPHSEDIPNTSTPGNSAGFFIRPFNYFDEDPSIASRGGVFITPTKDGSKVERFGRFQASECTPKDEPITYNGREL